MRLEAARTEVARGKVIASHASPGAWRTWNDGHVGSPEHHIGGIFSPTNGSDPSERLANATHAAANDPEHVLRVLEIHRLMLTLADPWLLNRLDQPGPITDPVRALIDLYAPVKENADA